jgi:hypothetical protein
MGRTREQTLGKGERGRIPRGRDRGGEKAIHVARGLRRS